MNILLSGGTGLIGKELQKKLRENGHQVRILSRKPFDDYFFWNIEQNKIDERAFENLDGIIHLAGATIAQRWTKSVKQKLYYSRVDAANLLFEYTRKHAPNLKFFISASGVNYYGTVTQQTPFKENDLPGNDFLAKLCVSWEQAAFNFNALGARVVCLRTGIVLSKKGGILKKLLPISKLGLNSAVGTGKQYVPWIHIEDLCLIYLRAVEKELKGSYNAVAPEQIKNEAFNKILNQAIGRKSFLPNVPSLVLKLVYGEMASILLEGSPISSRKIESTGFQFRYKSVNEFIM